MGDAGLSRFGKAGVIVLLLAETAAAAVAIRYFFWSLSVYDPIYRVLYHRPVPASGTILAVTAAILLLILLPLRSGGTAGLHRSAKEWFPLIGAGALLLFPVNSTPIVLLAAILLIAWGFYRHGAGVAELPSSAPRFHLSSRGGAVFFASACGRGLSLGILHAETRLRHSFSLLFRLGNLCGTLSEAGVFRKYDAA